MREVLITANARGDGGSRYDSNVEQCIEAGN